MSKKDFNVPVLMYHTVGIPDKKWNWNYLTCPFDRFEEQLIAIKEMGYITISLNMLYDYMVKGKDIPKKSIAITFDDGYADIWVFAYPLLKKYGMCGTVFINPDFVDKRKEKRLLYSKEVDLSNLSPTGFLSWEEIITMDKERVVFSESHALTHTWYPNSDKIIDFRHPGDSYTWMTWNKYPNLKPDLQIDNKSLVEYGSPVYVFEKSLSAPRYFPDKRLDTHLQEFVEKKREIAFFDQIKWKDLLYEEIDNFNKMNKLQDRYETENEYKKRIRHELKFTKDILEKKLNRKITFLCWPGGSATEVGMKIAKECGYQFFNSAKDMSLKQKQEIRNIRNGGNRVKRFTPFKYWDGKECGESSPVYADKLWMKLMILRHTDKKYSKYWYKLIQIFMISLYRIKKNQI